MRKKGGRSRFNSPKRLETILLVDKAYLIRQKPADMEISKRKSRTAGARMQRAFLDQKAKRGKLTEPIPSQHESLLREIKERVLSAQLVASGMSRHSLPSGDIAFRPDVPKSFL